MDPPGVLLAIWFPAHLSTEPKPAPHPDRCPRERHEVWAGSFDLGKQQLIGRGSARLRHRLSKIRSKDTNEVLPCWRGAQYLIKIRGLRVSRQRSLCLDPVVHWVAVRRGTAAILLLPVPALSGSPPCDSSESHQPATSARSPRSKLGPIRASPHLQRLTANVHRGKAITSVSGDIGVPFAKTPRVKFRFPVVPSDVSNAGSWRRLFRFANSGIGRSA